jgi:hypothetical protein
MADWTIEEFTVLRERWEAGDTGQQIADLFGNRSRSAVIAKARQAGFKQPPKPKKPKGQLLSKGYRKAFASQGDDMRARFVRVDQGDGEHGRKRRQNRPRLPGFESSFIQEGRTKFPKAIGAPDKDILVSGYNNIKIGKSRHRPVFQGLPDLYAIAGRAENLPDFLPALANLLRQQYAIRQACRSHGAGFSGNP